MSGNEHEERRMGGATVLCLAAALLGVGCVSPGMSSESAVLRAKNRVAPALVHIRPVKEVFSRGQRQEVPIIGSGFIISSDGFVITNEHVAGESTFVKCVLSNKEEVEAEVVGVDPHTDIAVLKLKVDHPMPYVIFGDSDLLESGQTVLALGSPHGLARSVSLGIVSVTNRNLERGGLRNAPFNNWIQTDAAINPGNSGGPLVNLRGEVIGVNARTLRNAENVGFAIPINIAREVSEQLILYGRVRRADLGLTLQEMLARTEDPSIEGVVIADVNPLSSAAERDVRPGDLLLAVNGTPVNARFEEDLPAVRKIIADLPVGEAAVLRLRRGGRDFEVTAVTEEYGRLRGDQLEFKEWGFTAVELTPDVVRAAQLPDRNGIMVSGAQAGSVAANARLSAGDIILKVDGSVVKNLDQFQEIYREKRRAAGSSVLLFVKRGALTRFVLVKQNEDEEDANGEEKERS